MKKSYWIILGIVIVLGVVGYWRYRQYPLPNPPAQQQRIAFVTFFATKPSLSRTKTFLKKQNIDYNQLSNADIFAGNTSTDFQRLHQKKIGSEIVFRIFDIKKPFCGHIDVLFIASFNTSGQLLKAEDMDWPGGCLDF